VVLIGAFQTSVIESAGSLPQKHYGASAFKLTRTNHQSLFIFLSVFARCNSGRARVLARREACFNQRVCFSPIVLNVIGFANNGSRGRDPSPDFYWLAVFGGWSSFSLEVFAVIRFARSVMAAFGSAPDKTIFCRVAAHSVVDSEK